MKIDKMITLLSILIFVLPFVIALQSEKIYFLYLEYDKGTLELKDVYLITGYSTISDKILPYKLELLSIDKEILYKGYFDIPNKLIALPPLEPGEKSGAVELDNLNFSISLPYYKKGNVIKIIKDDRELLSIDVSKFSMYCGDSICQSDENSQNCPHDCIITNISISTQKVNAQPGYFTGELEVLQYDSSTGSGYLYYLKTSDSRYKIESNGQLPPFTSGSLVTLRGTIQGNTIFVDASDSQSAQIVSQDIKFKDLPVSGPASSESASKIKFTWLYFTFPVFVLLGFFLYHEIERKKGHSDIREQKRQHLLSGLRNYAASNIKKGYKKEQIKDALIKNNYSENDVDEAFKGL
ncbi:hypothetical protein HYS31_00150 [Candidatus Woesearchaeota archaeon]|nr:hypothetical protein [Candidatus Woesearchaeota archaeon]